MHRKIFTKVSFNQDDLKYHVAFWFITYILHWLNFAFTFVNPSIEYVRIAQMTANLTILSTIIFSYLNTYFLLPATVGNEKITLWKAIILYFAVASLFAIGSSLLFQYLHDCEFLFDKLLKAKENSRCDETGQDRSTNVINFDWKRNIPESFFNMYLLTGLVYIRKWFHNFEMLRIQNELLEKENDALERIQQVEHYKLKALNQQIKPHFMFNALNHIYLKSLQNPTAVPEIVERFSDALEYITYDCTKEKVPLVKELEFIEKFIAIELQGLDKNTYQLDLDIDKNFDKNLEITPLLLLVLVENGVKYGIKKTDKGKFMKLKIKIKNECELSFSMENSQPTEMMGIELHAGGIGIRNMRERLKSFYQNKHKIELNSKNDIFETKLKIQLL